MATIELLRIYSISNGYLTSSVDGEQQHDEFHDDISEVLLNVAQLAGDSVDATLALQEAYQEQKDIAFARVALLGDKPEGTTILPDLETEEGYDTDTIV